MYTLIQKMLREEEEIYWSKIKNKKEKQKKIISNRRKQSYVYDS